MSSWTNKDVYVSSDFGTSSVNGYYLPDVTENHWYNSVNNNILLVFSGTYWWIRDRYIGSNYMRYYYGVADITGLCDGLTFSNTESPLCVGALPVGSIIYAGVFEENSSSSSSSSNSSESSPLDVSSSSSSSSSYGYTSSSSSSSGNPPAMALIYTSTGYYADIQMQNGEISESVKVDLPASPYFKIASYNNVVYAVSEILGGAWKLHTLYDDGTTDYIKDLQNVIQRTETLDCRFIVYPSGDMICYNEKGEVVIVPEGGSEYIVHTTTFRVIVGAVVSKDIEGTPYLYVLSNSGQLIKYAYKTWKYISHYSFSYLNTPTALGEYKGKLYAASLGPSGTFRLTRLDLDLPPINEINRSQYIQNIPLWTRGLVSVNGDFYGMSGYSTFLMNMPNATYSLAGTSNEYCYCLTNGSKGSIDDNSSSSGSIDSNESDNVQSISSEEQLKLFSVILNQGHHDILPFSFIQTSRELTGKILNFSYDTSEIKIPYNSILDFANNATNTITNLITTSTFIPESEDAKYKHEPIFYVDIIVEGDGVNQYSLRSQENLYVKENPTITFNIPKFSWDDSIFGYGNSSESSQDDIGYVWVGTSDKLIHKIEYNDTFASILFSANAPSEVHRIKFGQIDNSTYISCYDHIVRFIGASYYDGEDFHKEAEILNPNNDLVNFDDKQSGQLITTESYQGELVFRNRETMDVISSFGGFDAPFKALWSKAHDCYFVAGTHTLWRFVDGEKTAIYNINNYSIVDFDISETGNISVIFKGENSYIVRFLSFDLYTILYSETINDGVARYCRYCEQGIFYVLIELNDVANYTTNSIIFDSLNMAVERQSSSIAVVTTTTTTTQSPALNKVEMVVPVATTIWEKGSIYDIKWNSNASYTDTVKIELYKGINLVGVIAEQTVNTGVYSWSIPETYENGTDYKIKIMWLSAGDTSNYDITDGFTITDIPQTTTTTTTKILATSIGIEYNEYDRNVVNVLSNGMISLYGIFDFVIKGLFESGTSNVSCMALKDKKTNKFKGVNKARVYVGSEPHISDKWDSGVIETDKTSMYYGGGRNLTPGNIYYVNIQVYSDKHGWSEVQSKEFIMPK